MATNVRHFTAASVDKITLALGGFGSAFGPSTILSVFRLATIGTQRAIAFAGAAGTAEYGLKVLAANVVGYEGDNVTRSGGTALVANNWYLGAATKATGTVAARIHRKDLSTGTWSRANTGTIANSSVPITRAQIGAWVDGVTIPFDGDIYCVAFWAGTALADATLDGFTSLNAIIAAAPTTLLILDQASTGTPVTDYMASGADQTAISGTSVVSVTIPNFDTSYPSVYEPTVLADSPAAYWRLGEASGTAAVDSSGNSHPGTYGAGVTLHQPSLITDVDDSGAVFADVANSIITINDLAVGDFSGNQAFSLEIWFNATTLDGTGRRFFEKYPSDGYELSIDSSTIAFERDSSGSGGADDIITCPSPATGGIHHVVATYDGTNMRLYLDAVLRTGPTAATHTLASLAAEALQIGGLAGSLRFIGTLDEPAIYLTALSAARVLAHYNAGTAVPAPEPASRTRTLIGVGT